jgi:hypothetical protein
MTNLTALLLAISGLTLSIFYKPLGSVLYRMQLPGLKLMYGEDYEKNHPNGLVPYRISAFLLGVTLLLFVVITLTGNNK